MQHEAFASSEDFEDPARAAGPGRPGHDAPYAHYELGRGFDEMFAADGGTRAHYQFLGSRLRSLSLEELNRRQQACELSFLHQGITFTVYSDARATERIIPTDLLPRIVTATQPEFGWAAATAITQWVFKAPYRGGEPVDVKVRIPFRFVAPPH